MTGIVYHGPIGEPYYVTDSAFGIARAARHRAKGIDLNVRTCRANKWSVVTRKRRIVVVHWSHWWEHGFVAKPGAHVPRRPIEQLTLEQVRNLISVDGKHEILTAEQAALRCKIHGVIPFFEMKPSIWNRMALVALRAFCNARHIKFAVMTIQSYGHTERAKDRWERKAYKRMALAHDIGIPTMLLYRRPLDWTLWGWVLTAIKGHAAHGDVVDLTQLIRRLEKK